MSLPVPLPVEDLDEPPRPKLDFGRVNGWAWRTALVAVWFWTWRHLAVEWRLNDQYQYGFAIPFLAAYAGWQRIQALPASDRRPDVGASPALWGAIALGWFIFFGGELVREQDPTWRLGGGLLTLGATLLTAVWCRRWGGALVLRSLWWPLLFTWLALPWPSAIENGVSLRLMQAVTGWTVTLLNASGIAALQHGNTIELSHGWVGVDTACSGVQSFQASLVVALFLGEFYSFGRGRRLALLLVAWGIALAGNLGRIVMLTRYVHSEGGSAVEKYHDGVGLAATLATFAGIFALAWFMGRKLPAPPEPKEGSFVVWLGHTMVIGVEGAVLLAGVVVLPVLAWIWFAVVPGEGLLAQEQPLWKLRTEAVPGGWQPKEDSFTLQERNILRYSEGQSLELQKPGGRTARMFHLFWKPETSIPSMAFSHSPDVCMPSAGWTQLGAIEPATVEVRGRQVKGAFFRFELGGVEQIAFHALWYGGRPEELEGHLAGLGGRGGRVRRLWTGPRRQGHEVLTVFLPRDVRREHQTRELQALLEDMLVFNAEVVGNNLP